MDWVAVLGPGGAIGLLVVLDRLITKWRLARKEAHDTVVASWREIADESRYVVRQLQAELEQTEDELDYWRDRSGHAEYLLRVNDIPFTVPVSVRRRMPASPPVPPLDAP
jgi:hypothetical protein